MADWHGYPQAEGAHPERPWWRRERVFQYVLWRRRRGGVVEDDAAMAAYDAAHPLPPPEPRCGQVWDFGEGHQSMIVDVHEGVVLWGDGSETRHWSRLVSGPSAPVLVAGPGAPWAPMGGE